jgi:hypothetical protein
LLSITSRCEGILLTQLLTQLLTKCLQYRKENPALVNKEPFLLSPAPARKKSEGQNCSVPLRSSPQFFQIVYAALFCAALIRSIKGHPQGWDKKARLRQCVKSTANEKHGKYHKDIIYNPARRPAGQGRARGANPHAPPCLHFSHKQPLQRRTAARGFNIFFKQLHRPL